MKIFLRFFLTFFSLFFAATLLIQTPFAKEQIKKILISFAEKHGIQLSIQKLKGNLPFEWQCKNVQVQFKNQVASFDTIKVRFAIFPLFKKHLELSYLKVQGAHYKEICFDATASIQIDLENKGPICILQLLIEGENLYVRLDGKIQSDFTIQEGNMSFHLPSTFPLFCQGSLIGDAHLTKECVHMHCKTENLFIQNTSFETTSLHLSGVKKMDHWEGVVQFSGGPKEIPLQASTQYLFSPSCHLISFKDFQMNGPELHCFGDLEFDPNFKCLEGTLSAHILDLRVLRPLFPNTYLEGHIGGKIQFQSFSKCQDVKFQLEAKDLGYKDSTCKVLAIDCALYDLFGDLRGEFSVEAAHIKAPKMDLQRLSVSSIFEPDSSPFSLFVKGNWDGPLEAFGKGDWKKKDGGIVAQMHSFSGAAFQKKFSLENPCTFDWTPNHFKIHNFSLNIGSGHLFSRIDLTKSTSLIKIKAEDFPLEFIPLPHSFFSLAGVADVNIDLISWNKNLEGSATVALKRALFLSEGKKDPLTTKGSLQVHVSKNIAQVHGELKAVNEQFVHLNGTFPITFKPLPST